MSDAARILITGANGFVGRHLVSALNRTEPTWSVARIGGLEGGDCDHAVDISDQAAVEELVRDVQPTAIVHLAAVAAVGSVSSDPRFAWGVNAGGTLNVLIAIERHAPKAHLLYVSSAEVYGETFISGSPVDETMEMKPLNLYAASKAASEILVRQAARSGVKATIVRPFNHTGPGQSPIFVIPAFAEQVAAIEAGEREAVVRVGNLDDQRDFSDVRDIVAGYVRILQRGDAIESGSVFNLASGKSRRIGDLLSKLLDLSKTPISVERDMARYRPSQINRVVANIDKANRVLGWHPKIGIDETLVSVLEGCRAVRAGNPT